VTYTKRGAQEAVERACKKFNFEPKSLPFFRTLHSLCYRQLGMRNSDVLTGKTLFEFADYARVRVTGRAWSADLDGTMTGFEVGDRILFMENLARIRRIPLKVQYDLDNDGLHWPEVERVAGALVQFKAKRNVMDFTDMLQEFVAMDNDCGLDKLFVDEAQDLSTLQWEVVGLLARSASRVIVAGDDDQAIYIWSGANVAHLIDMEGDVRVLGQSYRCPPVIQQLSDRIISPIAHRRQKHWKAKPGEDGIIEHATDFDNVAMGEGSVMILARNGYISKGIEPSLRASGVVFERNGVSSIKPTQVEAMAAWEDLKRARYVTMSEVGRMYSFISTITKDTTQGIERGFKKKVTDWGNQDDPVTMQELIDHFGLKVDPKLLWHDALDKLPNSDMSYMLACLKRGDKLRGSRPRVRLSTIHSAKGGEADHVILMKEIAERTYNEMLSNPNDERRVWYVGVTRARERLTMVNSTTKRECKWL
jgi:DNA helicase-2/ATP-dependent DNA helicase PcrA